ncbi:hypothetical protein LSCM1_02223 [Leishmania martiniquensis]|uniref:Uncharacterized protein n=1 Tax=Leishmania martiniquensis TaxID=1580590 RepID=A0A836KEV8_9TRYP|nr:hypothetical protein LSCM1_02223 [Leishmania martiniquensis]
MSYTQSALLPAKARRKGVVYLGSNTFIELDDDPSTITLEDLCEAFGTPWESGMHVKHRATGRIVATLPFEPLPSLEDVADVAIATERTVAIAGTGDPTFSLALGDAEGEPDDAEDSETAYAVVYDLVTSTAPGGDENSELAAAVAAAGLTESLSANADGAPSIGETMRQLVELGAAELLTAEPVSLSKARREYNPSEAPGLLRRIVYPASQYSPYRLERDPLFHGKRPLPLPSPVNTGVASASSPATSAGSHALLRDDVGEGGPYTSYLDSYVLSCPMEVRCMRSPAISNKAMVTPLSDDEHHRIFGS